MSDVTLEKVLEEVKALTPEEQKLLLDTLEKEIRSAEQAERERVASEIRGKYANVLTSSEKFAARKA